MEAVKRRKAQRVHRCKGCSLHGAAPPKASRDIQGGRDAEGQVVEPGKQHARRSSALPSRRGTSTRCQLSKQVPALQDPVWYVLCSNTLPVAPSTSAELKRSCRQSQEGALTGRAVVPVRAVPTQAAPARIWLACCQHGRAALSPWGQAHRAAHGVGGLCKGSEISLGGGQVGGVARVHGKSMLYCKGGGRGAVLLVGPMGTGADCSATTALAPTHALAAWIAAVQGAAVAVNPAPAG